MGDFRVRKITDAPDRRKMYEYALKDIAAFEWMLKENLFETGSPWIGAEQELCIVNQQYEPATMALQLLDSIDDQHYTNELALFNLEINLDPLPFSGDCFTLMEKSLLELMKKGHQAAANYNSRIFMTGILPTLKYRHLQFDYMTPVRRYQTLSKELSDIRGTDFEIHIQGVDEVIMSLGSVLFEACNTSFQLHLQVAPDDFVNQHNWSQMIAGPVLSACVNSPMLFGNELWAETRIALFKQSLDTRSSKRFLRKKLPRVYFGHDWLKTSAAELWKGDLMRFPLLVTSDGFQDASVVLEKGEIPDLRAIRLHNGTTYTWNRLCYGYSKKKPHLRIECRYLPAGPSAIDEMANFVFWTGLMKSEPEEGVEFWKQTDFKIAKNNFIKAARTGLKTVFQWFGKNKSAKALILEDLLPMAQSGLAKHSVASVDIDKYLTVFERRVLTEITGADWIVQNFRRLSKNYGEVIAQREIVRQSIYYQHENTPVYQWENIGSKVYSIAPQKSTVEELMSTDIFCVNENDSIELVKSMLKWNNIHHLPVEDLNGNLAGLITDGMMERLEEQNDKTCCYAKDFMLTNLVTLQADDRIEKAIQVMADKQLSGLPVVFEKKLVGILTTRDLEKVNNNKNTVNSPFGEALKNK